MEEFEQTCQLIEDVKAIKVGEKKLLVDAELLGETGSKGVKTMSTEEYRAAIDKLYFK